MPLNREGWGAPYCALRRILNFHRIGLFRGSMSQKLPFSINICFNIKHLIVPICSFSWICILNSAYFLINLVISVLLISFKNVFFTFYCETFFHVCFHECLAESLDIRYMDVTLEINAKIICHWSKVCHVTSLRLDFIGSQ